MNRRGWVLGAAAVAAAGAGALWRQRSTPDDGGPVAGAETRALWTMRFERPDGNTLAMSSLLGRPLVLNFWATWCPPCVREMPELDRFQRRFSPRGWQVVGLAVDRAEAVREFLARTPVGYPIAIGGADATTWMRRLGNDAGGLPFTVAFGAHGEVVRRKLGETSFDELARWVGEG